MLAEQIKRLRKQKMISQKEEWPDVIQVLRESGTLATTEERKRIARIIRASLDD